MPALIERPEDELQHMIGRLIWENTALRYQVESLKRQLDEAEIAARARAEAQVPA